MTVGIDMFCSADDEHRVVLLVELLQRAGQAVVLRAGPVADPTDPSLIACTRRSLAEPWVRDLFNGAIDVVAVRLDTTPLPQPCARVIDMQSWPARSADRKVAALVGWLVRHRDSHGGTGAVQDLRPAGAGVEAAAPGPSRRRRPRQRASDGLRALVVVGGLVLGGGLLWLAAPEPGDRAGGSDAGEPAMGRAAPGATADVADATGAIPGNAAQGARVGRTADDGPGGSGEWSGGETAAGGGQTADDRAGADSPRADQVSAAASPVASADSLETADALAHFCNARSVDAARAWARALSWRQRLRLPDEPCVERLLARPGFEVLESLR